MTSHDGHDHAAHQHAMHEGHEGHQGHQGHQGHGDHAGHAAHGGGVNAMAASATLHCLTGCAIGEIAGLMIGTAVGLGTGGTIVLAIVLAFVFGYTLSTLPLLKSGVALGAAFSVVLAADTLSIATMELVDNLVMALIPGAMEAGLVNVVFWVGMMISLAVAFVAAFPVNRYLLQRGKGHALTHEYHGAEQVQEGVRPRRIWQSIPSYSSGALAAVIIAFMLGGLSVAIADEMDGGPVPAEQGEMQGH